MLCEILIGGVDVRLVSAGVGDARLEVVRNKDFGHASQELEGVHMRPDPGGEILGEGGLCECVVAGTEGGDENLSLHALASGAVYDGDSLAGVINKELFPGPVFLTEGDIELFDPLAVTVAELAILISLGVVPFVLVPQKLEGDSFSLELLEKVVHGRHVAPLLRDRKLVVREKKSLKAGIIEGRIQGPGETGQLSPL